ncbi:MAG: hypothetical protein EXR72_22230 [Myxococcales bacterium]|nr:hypothetical protein [Myxococcales bacterium]
MIRVTVGEVVTAGLCPRRFALVRSGARAERPRGTPVGAIVHDVARAFVAAAPTDADLLRSLQPARPAPDEVAARVIALCDALFVDRVAPRILHFDGDDLLRAGAAIREVARLLSTLVRRARVAGASAEDAVRRTLVAAERSFVLPLATPAGDAQLAGRFDLMVRNEVDARVEVWELKTHAEESQAADEQAALYALALSHDLAGEGAPLRPAVIQLGPDGRVGLRAVGLPDARLLRDLGARVAAMATWAASPGGAPPTDERARCVACPVRAPCWERHGPTLGATATAPVDVLLGTDESGAEVRWSPDHPDQPLHNFGFLVTGDSGMGKTQLLRALSGEVRAAGLPVLIFDFKNDFSSPDFAATAGLRVHDVRDQGLPGNPLALLPDGGEVRPVEHAYQVAGILGRVLGLGVQQQAALRRAIIACYVARGLDGARHAATAPIAGPDFSEVLAAIDAAALRARLDPLVDLGLLRGGGDVPSALLSSGLVLDLHLVADPALANALVELALLAIHAHLLGGEQPRRLRRLLVLDEARRVASSSELAWLLREGRAFGLGCAIGTQYPGDLPDEVQGALATKLFLHNDQDAHRAAVCRQLLGTVSGDEALTLRRTLRDLPQLEGFLANPHHRPYRRLRVLPHHARAVATTRPA